MCKDLCGFHDKIDISDVQGNNGVQYLRYTLIPNAPTNSGCSGCNYISSSRPSTEIAASHELLEAVTNEALKNNYNPTIPEFSDFCAGGNFQTTGFKANQNLVGYPNPSDPTSIMALSGWGRQYWFQQVPIPKQGGGYTCGPEGMADMTS
jgi:hypothetical protein